MTKYLPSPFTQFSQELLSHLDSIFWNYNNTKFSYPELSHRSEHYGSINFQAQELIKAYFDVPKDYHIVFLPNEAAFAAIPFNLNIFVNNSAIYLVNDA
jgi:phosphoserine aminotransferase